MWESQLVADATAQADDDRTKRAFIGFLSTVLGVDQTPVGQDGAVGNATGQYVIANPDGTYSTQGRSVSNVQGSGGMQSNLVLSPGLLMLAGIAFFILRK